MRMLSAPAQGPPAARDPSCAVLLRADSGGEGHTWSITMPPPNRTVISSRFCSTCWTTDSRSW